MNTAKLNRAKTAGFASAFSRYSKGLGNFKGTNTFKFFKNIAEKAKKGGASSALDEVAQYADPTKHIGKNIPKRINLKDMQKGEASLARGLRTSLGNSAQVLKNIGKDTKGKGIFGGAIQAGKNTGDTLKKQFKGDLYTEVKDPTIRRKGNKEYVKSKVPFLSDREIVSKTNRGSSIIKKRKAMQPLSVALGDNGLAIGATTYAFSDKNRSKADRLGSAATDAALFTVSPPAGIASALLRAPKKTKKKKSNK